MPSSATDLAFDSESDDVPLISKRGKGKDTTATKPPTSDTVSSDDIIGNLFVPTDVNVDMDHQEREEVNLRVSTEMHVEMDRDEPEEGIDLPDSDDDDSTPLPVLPDSDDEDDVGVDPDEGVDDLMGVDDSSKESTLGVVQGYLKLVKNALNKNFNADKDDAIPLADKDSHRRRVTNLKNKIKMVFESGNMFMDPPEACLAVRNSLKTSNKVLFNEPVLEYWCQLPPVRPVTRETFGFVPCVDENEQVDVKPEQVRDYPFPNHSYAIVKKKQQLIHKPDWSTSQTHNPNITCINDFMTTPVPSA